MCGIVGLFVKTPSMRDQLGELMLPMLIGMSERGPESAGLVVFTDPVADNRRKFSVYSGAVTSGWDAFALAAQRDLGNDTTVDVHANHAVVVTSAQPSRVKTWLTGHYPNHHLLSVGKSIDLYKDTGTPGEVAERYGFSRLQGTHLVGHTRMATETAVTPARAHPFTAGEDFCLVHNGSLSNPNSIRRKLEPLGIVF
jgi:amidophosphoribosyltransferase